MYLLYRNLYVNGDYDSKSEGKSGHSDCLPIPHVLANMHGAIDRLVTF